jgi:4'-phosphopantetheinyl transferase
MQLYWLEQTESDVPAHTDWLNASDAAHMHTMRFAKRRADWLLGRWTAKRAVAAWLRLPTDPGTLAKIEIRPEPSGAPEAYLSGSPASVSISLSHSSGLAVCAVAESGVVLGCDLEIVERRSDNFIRDYFTAEELAQVAQADATARDWLVTLLWSAKESALKALRTGLRLDTRSLAVTPLRAIQSQNQPAGIQTPGRLQWRQDDLNAWHPLQVCCATGQVFQGWWQHVGSMVGTVVAAPPLPPPVQLSHLGELPPPDAQWQPPREGT